MAREEDTKMAGHAKIVRQPKRERDGTPHIKVGSVLGCQDAQVMLINTH